MSPCQDHEWLHLAGTSIASTVEQDDRDKQGKHMRRSWRGVLVFSLTISFKGTVLPR
jgi:hypothetical protein